MDNPYWFTKGKTHNIDLSTVRRMCFELTNIFSAGRELAEGFDAMEAEEGKRFDLSQAPLLALHMELAEDQACNLLLQMVLLVRTYDDVMKNSGSSKAYVAHATQTSGKGYIGGYSQDGQDFDLNLRQACNKIIHALEIRAVYERIDRTVALDEHGQELDQEVWYLTGEIEMVGTDQGKPWEAVVHAPALLEIVLDRIAFGYPEPEEATEK
ncbi:hypothetical protein [Microvirga tunisiensis]|uniref:Uncharacterized protein n=1 Tax=Microvirga tunisiensis TaxID=2108360 RepID=A0A5N7MGP8_9HYPH|nr:hypothetical protein [Microvirga tunisiensis]MPR06190.1 hypothetical protein [Microvirga tunisiensis]MPR26067.1 hypothetical protein [Microvirga tunisiensis]